MKRFVLYCLLLAALDPVPASAQEKTDAFLRDLLRSQASPFLLRVLDKPDFFRYQLI